MSTLLARVFACLTKGRGPARRQRICKAAAGAAFANCIQLFSAKTPQHLAAISPTSTTPTLSLTSILALSLLLTTLAATTHADNAAIYTRRIGINVTPTTELEVSGTISATNLVINGTTYSGTGSSPGDFIASGTTKVTANSTGYVSFTTGGVTTGYMDTAGKLIIPGISSTGTVSGTVGIFSNGIGIGGVTATGGFALRVSGTALVTSQTNLAWGDYSITSPTVAVGDVQYGMSSSGGTTYLYAPYAGGFGAFAFRNYSSTTNVMTVDMNGKVNAGMYLANTVGNTPTGQGAYTTWNLPNGTGRTSFMNQIGSGSIGGFEFRNYDNSNTLLNTPVVITSSGYVGIGTSTPGATLDVSGSLRAGIPTGASVVLGNGTIAGSNNGGAAALYLNTNSNQNTYIGGATSSKLAVGLGTITPSATLHVSGSAIISGTLTATAFVGDGSGLTGIVGASSGDNIASGTTKVTANTTGYVSFTTGGTTTGYMDTGGNFILPGISTTGLISATSVTIGGAPAANYKLTVNGPTYVGGNIYGTSVVYAGTSFVLNGGGTMPIYWNGSNNAAIYGDATSKFLYFTTSGTEAMRIVSTGYVGIGTSTPSTTLNLASTNSPVILSIFRNSSVGHSLVQFGNLSASVMVGMTPSGSFAIGPGATLQSDAYMTVKNNSGYVGIATVTPTTALEVSGTVSATRFVGDGSLLTGVIASSNGDNITSGTTKVTANTTGYVSFTTGGTTTGYMDTSGKFVLPGVSTTGPISATTGYFNGTVRGTGSAVFADLTLNNATGIYWSGLNDKILGDGNNHYLAFTTSGTEAMRIVSTGYVGIGTTTPFDPLDVAGPLSLRGELHQGMYWSGSNWKYSLSGTPAFVIRASSGMTQFRVAPPGTLGATANTKDAMLINGANGYIGMGVTVTPSTQLEVSGTISATRFVGDGSLLTGIVGASSGDNIASGTTKVTANQTGYISFTTGGTTTGYMDTAGNFIVPGVSLTTSGISSTSGYFTGKVGIGTPPSTGSYKLVVNGPMQVAQGNTISWGSEDLYGNGSALLFRINSGTEAMRIVSTGYVGIGTSIPVYPVHVSGTIYGTGTIYAGGWLMSSNGLSDVGANNRIAFNTAQNHQAFYTSNTEAMRIVSTGYVGIGTSAPAGLLDISGTTGRAYIDSAGTSLNFTRAGDNYIRASATGGKLSLVTNGNTRLLVDSTGNVGIGTATIAASSTLHVSGTTRITSWTYIGDNITPTTALEVSGTISATRFVGDGSLLTGIVGASSGDNIASGTTKVTANQTGYISFTTGGTTTGYMDTAGNFILPGISTTGTISATNGYFTSPVGIGTAPQAGYDLYAIGQIRTNNNVIVGNNQNLMWGDGSTYIRGRTDQKFMALYTSATEAMRIVSSGYVGIGTITPTTALEVSGTISATALRSSGDIEYSGTLRDTSDRRLKTKIEPLPYDDVLGRVMLLKPVQYERKAVPGRIEWGFIAQDVEQQFPQLVTAANDASGTLSISYLGLLPPVVQAIQQLKADNDNLRAQVGTLKAANDNLTGRLDAQQQKLEAQQRDIDALKKSAGLH